MTSSPDQPEVRRYPVRGALWGLIVGISLALWAVLTAMVTFGNWLAFALIVLAGIAIGVAWSYLAPPRGAKAAPPAKSAPSPVTPEPAPAPVTPSSATAPVGANETIQVDPNEPGGSFSSNL